MAVEVIADPGATWRASADEPYERGWDRFRRLLDATAEAGAPTFKPQYLRRTVYPEGSAEAQLVAGYEWPTEWLPRLKEACDARGLEFLCTVYETVHVALVDPYVKRWKVASFDVGNEALVRALLDTGKPLLVSLGLGQQRCLAFREQPERTVALHCVSAYPAPASQMNLARLRAMTGPKGLSDHTTGYLAALMAVALGATVIETHVRADDTPTENPDYPVSLSPRDLGAYVETIRLAEAMLGDGVHRVQPAEWTAYRYDPQTGKRGTRGAQ